MTCGGFHHTTGHHIRVAQLHGVNKAKQQAGDQDGGAGAGAADDKAKGKGKKKGKGKGKKKGKWGKGRPKGKGKRRERYFLQTDGSKTQGAADDDDEEDDDDEPEEYEGFFDEKKVWHDIVDGKCGIYDEKGIFHVDPPGTLECYWNWIQTERDEHPEEEAAEEENEAWEEAEEEWGDWQAGDGSAQAQTQGANPSSGSSSSLAEKFYGEAYGPAGPNAFVSETEESEEFLPERDHSCRLVQRFYAEETARPWSERR